MLKFAASLVLANASDLECAKDIPWHTEVK